MFSVVSCFYLFGDFRDGLSRTQFLIALYDLRLKSFVRGSNILPTLHNKIINTVLLVPVENSKVECSIIIFRSDYLEYCGVRDIEVFRLGSTPKYSGIILHEVAQCYL